MNQAKLICTACKKEVTSNDIMFRCDACGEPLELELVTNGAITEGNVQQQSSLERYAKFYPGLSIRPGCLLGEGFTALVPVPRLAQCCGVGELYLKNETTNPTWSFKDRGTVTGVLHAVQSGCKRIGTVSTGNMGVSVAAYGARAGLETVVLVSKDLPPEKLAPIAIYSPTLYKVEGDYSNLYFTSLELGKKQGICFINSDAPYRVEGYKTMAFEICEQLHFDMPDYVVVPTSAGGDIRGIRKGFLEFKACGLIDRVPKMICAQASGCSPIVNAFEKGEEKLTRVENHKTIAHAIENPFPPSGNCVLRVIAQDGGCCAGVTEDEILSAQRELAATGLFVQPGSAVGYAVVKKLGKQGYFKATDRVVSVLTGCGLKYTAVLEQHHLGAPVVKVEELDEILSGGKA